MADTTEYALYLESGPRRRKTMVHVLDLLGCTAQGPTTEEALKATPEAIREYLRFLQRYGEAVDPEAAFDTVVAVHVTEGSWIGNGDPIPGFAPDFQPLTAEELARYLRRLEWMQSELLSVVRDIPPGRLEASREGESRTISRILGHIAGAHGVYLRYIVGKVDGLSGALKAVEQSPDDVAASLALVWEVCNARLEQLTETEREQPVQHGQLTWTARRGVRRMLEHVWEHMQELSTRLENTAGGR